MSKPKGRYPFRVPNNDEGKEFIRLCRKYKQDGMEVRVRSSGVHAEVAEQITGNRRGFDRSMPLKYGTHLRVYVDPCKKNPGPEAKAQGVDPFTLEHVKLLERTSEYRDIER